MAWIIIWALTGADILVGIPLWILQPDGAGTIVTIVIGIVGAIAGFFTFVVETT